MRDLIRRQLGPIAALEVSAQSRKGESGIERRVLKKYFEVIEWLQVSDPHLTSDPHAFKKAQELKSEVGAMISIKSVLSVALITLLGHGIASLQTSQIQPVELIYTKPKDPVRLRLTGKILEVINYSDLEVKALSFGCITKDSDGKITVKKRNIH